MKLDELIEVVSEMDDHLEQEVDPELDTIEKWRTTIDTYIKEQKQ